MSVEKLQTIGEAVKRLHNLPSLPRVDQGTVLEIQTVNREEGEHSLTLSEFKSHIDFQDSSLRDKNVRRYFHQMEVFDLES